MSPSALRIMVYMLILRRLTAQLENGYTLWDFRGRQLGRKLVDRFKQFLWRPRPPTLLRQEQLQSIRKNLKKFSSEFDKEDAAMENSVGAELIARRRWMIDQWNQWRASVKKEIGADTPRHSEDVEEVEEWREELVETIFEEITE
jgi:translation initiation factor 3 subunit B